MRPQLRQRNGERGTIDKRHRRARMFCIVAGGPNAPRSSGNLRTRERSA
jgi:hypothetical protein